MSSSLVNAFTWSAFIEAGGQPITILPGAPILPPGLSVTKPDRAIDQPKLDEKERQKEEMRDVAYRHHAGFTAAGGARPVRLLETSRGVTIEINDSILFAGSGTLAAGVGFLCPAGGCQCPVWTPIFR